MATLIGVIFDNVLTLAVLFFFLFVIKRFWKRRDEKNIKLLLILLAIAIVGSLAQLFFGLTHIKDLNDQRDPVKVKKLMQKEPKVADEDFIFKSEYGFNIMIPKGTNYIIGNDLAPLMMWKYDEGNSIILTTELRNKNLQENELLEQIKNNLKNYQFGPVNLYGVALPPHIDYKTVKNNMNLEGKIFLLNAGTNKIIVNMGTYNGWEADKNVLIKIINSYQDTAGE